MLLTPRSRNNALPGKGLLLPMALGFAVLWLGVMGVAIAAVHSQKLLALGGASVLLTVALAVLMAEQHMRLSGLAATDALTGLVNQRGFHQALAARLRRARRDGRSLALVSIDLDDFKDMNDTHGHPYGDEILRAVGARLRHLIRPFDLAARIGGEEFALILPASDGEGAYAVAERARMAIADVPTRGEPVSCSAGIAVYPDDADDQAVLCQLADAALYSAKRAGKRRSRRYNPERVTVGWSEEGRAAVATLLSDPEPVHAVFQPIVTLATGKVLAYEALARFPGSALRYPEAWFARAHACGLGPELEAAAIRAALTPIGRPMGTLLALNVSPSALGSDEVAGALPADLSDLVIEITEHELLSDDEVLTRLVADLRERGALIAMDDAGAGYSGLQQVMRLRPDIVKLDRELIDGIHDDAARLALVESFVRFARRTGATVCAEGVESLEDVLALSDLDVQWGQGHALAKPAEPWAGVAPAAAEVCRRALSQALKAGLTAHGRVSAGDRGLERVSAELANVRSRRDLEAALGSIAAELHADNICLSKWHAAEGIVETLAENGPRTNETRFVIRDFPLTGHMLRAQEAVQVLVGDPESDPDEAELLLSLGHRSLLMVPVIQRGESVGLIEAFSDAERPWTRAEINRARIISNQFASVIQALFRSESRPGL